MSENDQSEIHVYDGIKEQNNPMPDWWIWLFILCVIFAFNYWIHYQFGGGETQNEEYKNAMTFYTTTIKDKISQMPAESEESLVAYMKNENAIHRGADIFSAKCAMCHGEHLEGKIGPNLTDQYWTTGNGSRMDIVSTISKGSAAKGMPPWESMLKQDEIKNVAAYVYSKIGSNPKNPKPAEGDLANNTGQ